MISQPLSEKIIIQQPSLPVIPQPSSQKNRFAACQNIVRINNLHKINSNKLKNAFATNYQIQDQLIKKKSIYDNAFEMKYKQKIQALMRSSHQKLQVIKKMHCEQQKKAQQTRLRKHKSMQSQTLKIRNKEIIKMQNAQKRRQQFISIMKASRKVQKNRLEFISTIKQKEKQYSIRLLQKTDQKINLARQRRSRNNSYISQRSVRSLDDKIRHSQQYVKSVFESAQIANLEYSISKQQKSESRLAQIININKRINEEKKKQNCKKIQQAFKFKKARDDKIQRKVQDELDKKMKKMQHVIENKQKILTNYKLSISRKMEQLTYSVHHRFETIHSKQMTQIDDMCEKQHQKWNFLTGLKEYENKIIQKNIHSNNKISLFR